MKKGTDQRDKIVALRRIEGQVRGVQKMVEDQRYCIDILTALGAIGGALRKVEAEILKNHLNACVKNAVEGKSAWDKEAKLEEIYRLFKGLRK